MYIYKQYHNTNPYLILNFSNRSSLRKSKSESRNLHKTGERIPQSIVNNDAFSIDEKEFEDRLGNKDDSDYWSTPSSSIRYRKSTLTYLIYSKRLLTLNIKAWKIYRFTIFFISYSLIRWNRRWRTSFIFRRKSLSKNLISSKIQKIIPKIYRHSNKVTAWPNKWC